MKGLVKIIVLVFLSVILISCEKDDFEKLSPKGYGLISTDYIGEASFEYITTIPNNVNDLTLVMYKLPSLWAKIEGRLLESVETVENSNRVFYAKYIIIGPKLFTAELKDGSVIYKNNDIPDLSKWLEDEVNAKWYCKQANLGKVYYSSLDGGRHKIVVREPNINKILITWAEENESRPNFSEYFSDYDAKLINQLFGRVYSNVEIIKK